jgi:dynein light chain roadblock-type
VIVINGEGTVVRSNMDNVMTIQYANLCGQLCNLAKGVVRVTLYCGNHAIECKDLDPENDLSILRVRTKKHELMLSSGNAHHIPVVPVLIIV